MAQITLTGASIGDDHAYYAEPGSYPLNGSLGATAAAGKVYSGINLTQGSGGVSYFYIKFDTSEIPNDADIISVSGNIKLYASTTFNSRTTTREAQLFSGSNAKGTSETYSGTGSSVTCAIDGGTSWTREEIDDLGIRVYCTRNSSNTSTNIYLYWMGADVTIEYEQVVKHTITVQAGAGIEVDKTSKQVKDGHSFELQINPNGKSIYSALDNGKDIKNALQKVTVSSGDSVTKYPEAYKVSGNISGTRYKNCIGKPSSTTATGNDYSNSSSSNATVYYSFDFSDIPENAIIDSVNVIVGGHCESTSNSSRKSDLQLYSGSTAKGSLTSFTSTSKQLITMNAGTWTRAELQEAKLAFTIGYYGGLVNGVDFQVNYSIPGAGSEYYTYTIASVTSNHTILINMDAPTGTNLRVKQNGSYKKVMKIFRKENGVWIEKTVQDLPSVDYYIYINGE